jgi:hypothetical protein
MVQIPPPESYHTKEEPWTLTNRRISVLELDTEAAPRPEFYAASDRNP